MKTPTEPSVPPERRLTPGRVAWLVAGTVLIWGVLSFQGLCVTRVGFLSDQELIASAVKSLAADGVMQIGPTDAAVSDFLKKHPTCCSVDRHPQSRNVLDVLTGWNYSEAEINFESSVKRAAAIGAQYYKQWIRIDACGKVLTYPAGTATLTLEAPKLDKESSS